MLARWSILPITLVIASGCCFGGATSTDPIPTPALGAVPGLPTAAPTPAGQTGTVTVAPGFMPDPQVVAGSAGGPVQASTLSADCRGYIAAQPNLLLDASAAFTNLRILVNAPADTTLVVQRADGSFLCNDDSEGLNPIVQGPFGAGQHRVWVGTYSAAGAGATYTIGVTELASVTAASLGAPAAPAGPGTVRTGALAPGDTTLQTGELSDSYEFTWTAGQRVRLDLASEFDNYLILRAPSGAQVDNDDTNGLNAAIDQVLTESGVYTVIVTTYASGQSGPYTLTVH